MDVDKANFFDILPQIEQSIAECDFLALDLEMTGLNSGKMERQKPWDSAQQRYLKVRDGAAVVCPTQFGLCTFKYIASSNSYEVHPYNIHIYPREFKWIDRFHTIQSSSLTFLRNHTFDFNKWIDQGVNWLSMDQHEQIATRLMTAFEDNIAKPITSDGPNKVALSEADTLWITDIYQKIDAWLSELNEESEKTEKSFVFDKTLVRNSFQRLLLYQELPRKYPNLTVMSDKDPSTGERVVKIAKLTPEEHQADIEARRNALKTEIKEAFGFGHVWKAIVDAKKPVLGHNMFLDLAICYHQFFKPLPEDSDEFCRQLHAAIPLIMDNKTIASKHPDLNGLAFETTALGDLANILLERFPSSVEMPKISIPSDFKRYKLPTHPSSSSSSSDNDSTPKELESAEATDSAYHEAGFDALQTGVVYLNLRAFYCTGALPCDPIVDLKAEEGKQSTPAVPREPKPISHPLLPGDASVVKLMNSLNLMQISGTFNLDRPHSMPDRRQMFVLSGLTSSDKPSHINDLFSNFGPFKISWIDTASCVLTFSAPFDPRKDAKIIAAPKSQKGNRWRIQRIAEIDSTTGVGRGRFNNHKKHLISTNVMLAFSTGVCATLAVIGAVAWISQKRSVKKSR
jgi:hypothetical protein